MPTSGWKAFALEQQYDPRYFARKYRLPIAVAREILRQAGSSRRRAIHLATTRLAELHGFSPEHARN